MDEQREIDWLDARLLEEVAYIDDDGFTARVMKQVPAHARPRSQRASILLGVTILASLITYIISGGGRFVADAVVRIAAMPLLVLIILALICGLLVTALGLAAAISKTRESRA